VIPAGGCYFARTATNVEGVRPKLCLKAGKRKSRKRLFQVEENGKLRVYDISTT